MVNHLNLLSGGYKMNRRDILKACAAGIATIAIPKDSGSAESSINNNTPKSNDGPPYLAAVCGMFCGNCGEMKEGRCHGCGCTCGKCAASSRAEHCSIIHCATKKNLTNCGDCKEFACSKTIMNTYDPIWKGKASCLDNLRRRKAIGTKAWISEQQKYWSDDNHAKKWAFAELEGREKVEKLKKDYGYTNPF
jgi:hypothetical protein